MKKIILAFLLCSLVNAVEAQFWGGFLQGALMGIQNAMTQQQIRQQQERQREQQERERRAREEANRIDKSLQIETGFKWYRTKQNGKYGAEDYYHNTLIPLSRGYESICFHPKEGHVGYFGVEKNGKEGACDITGKEIISTSYESVFYAGDGFNYKNSSGSYVPTGWYLDKEGKATKEVPITKNMRTEKDGFIWYEVRQGKVYGAEDHLHNTLIPLSSQCSSIYYMAEEGHKGYFKVKKDDKYGAYDLKGKEIASPIYESLIYSEGFKHRNSAGEWIALGWMLDNEGKGIRGTKESVTYNGKTYYIVSRDGLYGLTDSNGKEIVAKEMEKIEVAGGNRLKFKQNGSWGLMNFLGRVIIPTSRGYTSIGKYSKTQKTFSYTMYGYKGECNINGRQISKVKVNASKQVSTIASSNHSYTEVNTFDLIGKVKKCTYEDGHIIEFDKNGKYITNCTISYDTKGRIIQESLAKDMGRYKYEYDASGRVAVRKSLLFSVETKDKYYYGTNGRIEKCSTTNNVSTSESIATYSDYRNDSHGNWISRKKNGRVIETRTIEYW